MGEQVRQDASEIRAYIENAGYEVLMMSDGSRTAMPMDTAPVIDELDALLAELEQAEHERDEARAEALVQATAAAQESWREQKKRAELAEARLAKVPALVEALKEVLDDAALASHLPWEERTREALAAWEQE